MKLSTVLLSAVAILATASAFADPYSFRVKVTGHGKPIILIPGLTCPGEVWDGTVDHLKDKYECHVLTLPGFGKQAPISGPYITHVRDDIVAYVKDKKLDHPAVIGHSLGGFLVFSLASSSPKTFGPMISVDGVPFFSSIFNSGATPDTMKPVAEGMQKQMAAMGPDEFKASIKSTLEKEARDPKAREKLLELCANADPKTTGQVMYEMMTTDLRFDVKKVETPILLIGAGYGSDSADDKAMIQRIYERQVDGTDKVKVVFTWKARHFVMFDDPEFFNATVDKFLADNYK